MALKEMVSEMEGNGVRNHIRGKGRVHRRSERSERSERIERGVYWHYWGKAQKSSYRDCGIVSETIGVMGFGVLAPPDSVDEAPARVQVLRCIKLGFSQKDCKAQSPRRPYRSHSQLLLSFAHFSQRAITL
jgi:hypothetical protein